MESGKVTDALELHLISDRCGNDCLVTWCWSVLVGWLVGLLVGLSARLLHRDSYEEVTRRPRKGDILYKDAIGSHANIMVKSSFGFVGGRGLVLHVSHPRIAGRCRDLPRLDLLP